MKLSIITPTYNRANMLGNLYESIVKNLEQDEEVRQNVQTQWLVIDDGSTDNTEEVINQYIHENVFEIQYHKQENQGKMAAINHVIHYANGDLIVECDSDDIFSDTAFYDILQAYNEAKKRDDLYGLCFLKYDIEGNNIGNTFQKEETTMFDLYFKEQETGEKAIVFFANIRKQYHYKIENHEKFSTEARMYHEMDLKYKMKCINKPIMICDYKKDGYTKNIQKIFKENPYGHFQYFKEILEQHDMAGVPLKKRLYVIKHYILFSYLTKQYHIKDIKGFKNKMLYSILLIPGLVKSYQFKNKVESIDKICT